MYLNNSNFLPAQILQYKLGRLRLARPRLPGDNQGLIDAVALQVPVGSLCQGEHMRLQGPDLLSMIIEHSCLIEEIYKNR